MVTTIRKGSIKLSFIPYCRKAYYYETDRMDIIHHSNYIRWLEEARVDLMEQIGYPFAEMEAKGIVSPVLGVSLEYKSPVKFGDEFEINCKLTKFNGCKFELDYEIINKTTGMLSCKAHSFHCFTDASLKPLRLKKAYPQLFEKFSQSVEPCF